MKHRLEHYSHSSREDLLQDKLPIFDLYTNLSFKNIYERRLSGYTGRVYRWFCVELCLFRKAYVVTFEYTVKYICPVIAKQEDKKRRKNDLDSTYNISN